jgi:deferrochelatase/peroxidase EfeB
MERRTFLRAAAVAVGSAGLGAAAVGSSDRLSRADAASPSASPAPASIDLHGGYQPGILTERQKQAAFVSMDLTATSRSDLTDLMHTITDRVRLLNAGGTPPNLGISAPPSDSGTLGPVVPKSDLTVTVALGSTTFDERYGLAAQKPAVLRPMHTFPNDNLDPTRCHGDLLLQICADDSDTVLHALRDVTSHTRGGMQVRWRVDGFTSPPRPAGAPRNHMGFKDGTANPDVTDAALMNQLVWVQPGPKEPAWTAGGSYQVLRVIRMLVEFWDRVTIEEQERMLGRRRDNGAPLSGDVETDIPDYTNDATGSTTPLDAHIRVANPRTPATDANRILRRAYNYDRGMDVNGNLDLGLLFNCFQQDLDRQFVTVQKRLADEPLVDYISPVGGGYFFALPGLRDQNDYYASGLLTA